MSSDTPELVSDLITDGYEPSCGYWDLNSGPLEEESVLLTAEPSLQPLCLFIRSICASWDWKKRILGSQSGSALSGFLGVAAILKDCVLI